MPFSMLAYLLPLMCVLLSDAVRIRTHDTSVPSPILYPLTIVPHWVTLILYTVASPTASICTSSSESSLENRALKFEPWLNYYRPKHLLMSLRHGIFVPE